MLHKNYTFIINTGLLQHHECHPSQSKNQRIPPNQCQLWLLKTQVYHATTLTTHEGTFFLATLARFTTRSKALRPVISLVWDKSHQFPYPTQTNCSAQHLQQKDTPLKKSHGKLNITSIMFQTLIFFVLGGLILACQRCFICFSRFFRRCQKVIRPQLLLVPSSLSPRNWSSIVPPTCRAAFSNGKGLVVKEFHTAKSINRKTNHSYHWDLWVLSSTKNKK